MLEQGQSIYFPGILPRTNSQDSALIGYGPFRHPFFSTHFSDLTGWVLEFFFCFHPPLIEIPGKLEVLLFVLVSKQPSSWQQRIYFAYLTYWSANSYCSSYAFWDA
ncbi:UNVERIFIED_CONTAM: hypothetical protein Sangu_2638800 [Sesamum angustifolium]|uniref:Cytochrome c biogenesis B n=1 Tax=Sesamum angustifolium TaxID=2727405 RepID=A0AAW2J337_9LAMI